MDDLSGGNDGLHREVGLVHILHDPFADLSGSALPGRHRPDRTVVMIGHLIERRDIEALQPGRLPQSRLQLPQR